ncbi:MAG: POTRA domain-containing protein [Chitinophagales bacterium]
MTKLRLQISSLVLLFLGSNVYSQANYPLYISGVDADSATLVARLGLQTRFHSSMDCIEYINRLPGYLQGRGYVTASVDSVHYNPAFTRIVLFGGELYKWARLDASKVDPALMDLLGWKEKQFTGKAMDFAQVQAWEEKILDHLEKTGYPFARVYLDSLQLDRDKISGLLKVDKGPPYKIDSIRVYGNAKIDNGYLQRYLEIPNGSIYNKDKLLRVGKKLRELSYVEEIKPSDLTRLGTGSVLNLYLRQKRSSQVNILIGFLPNNDQLSSKKLLVTGEANINLKNAFGSGETMGLNWQQIQVKSPRLNVIYQHPYLFHSPLGLDFAFDMFRKDSAFLNVNLQIGARYSAKTNQEWKVFIQRFQTIVSGINKSFIIQNRKFDEDADLSSFNAGIDYEFNNTDYRPNPRKGNAFRIISAVGTKRIKKNSEVLQLKDPNDPSFDFGSLYDTVKLKTYQVRLRLVAEKYFPLGRQRSTLKTAINAGWFQSGNIFRNELFQIGGYRLLRGFDEERNAKFFGYILETDLIILCRGDVGGNFNSCISQQTFGYILVHSY